VGNEGPGDKPPPERLAGPALLAIADRETPLAIPAPLVKEYPN
jgi:hypothetical protein